MKYLRNPIDGRVVVATPLMAKKLFRYGWIYVTKADRIEYMRAQAQAQIVKHVKAARLTLGRLQ